MIDNRTPLLSLPLPHENNALGEDVFRLREAIGTIDTVLAAAATSVQLADLAASTSSQLASLIGSAPSTLNTLQELAAAIAGDAAFATTVTTSLANRVRFDAAQTLSDGQKTQAKANIGVVAYVHPSGDGNLHVPATGTSNLGRVLTAGATAGSLNWSPSGGMHAIVVSATTQAAVIGNHYVLTNVSSTTITLPAEPDEGDTVWVTVANALTTNVIARNGKTIMGVAENMTIDAGTATVQLRYVNNDWKIL